MWPRLDDLLEHLTEVERDIEVELSQARRRWTEALINLATAPIIYSLIVPICLLDLWVTLYQQVCFRAYGIVRVDRSKFIVVDRHHLAHLNGIEKVNCVFCGYANGVFAYVREVAGRTEQYWCPIRHASRVRGAHRQYRHFVDYGDAEGYKRRLLSFRADLKSPILTGLLPGPAALHADLRHRRATRASAPPSGRCRAVR